jgi:hypothetical protein
MLRHHRATGSTVPVRLLYSARSLDDVIYRDELTADRSDVRITLTRRQPAGWSGYARRVDRKLVAETCWPAAERGVHLRCHRVRRGRGRRPRLARPRRSQDSNGTIRTDRRRDAMTDSQALDGNAIAGTLAEVFGGEMTTAIGVCGHCGSRGPVA